MPTDKENAALKKELAEAKSNAALMEKAYLDENKYRKDTNTALKGKLFNAEQKLDQEKQAYGELVTMVQAVLATIQSLSTIDNIDKLETIIGDEFSREYHPCEDCHCPVHEQDTICEWCGHKQKG